MDIELSGAISSQTDINTATITQNEIVMVHQVSLGQRNINLDADLWDGYHVEDNIRLTGKLTIGSNSDNLRSTLNVYDDPAFNKNVEGIWSSNYLPDMPDDVGGRTYLADFSTLSGWEFSGLSHTLTNGVLVLTPANTYKKNLGSRIEASSSVSGNLTGGTVANLPLSSSISSVSKMTADLDTSPNREILITDAFGTNKRLKIKSRASSGKSSLKISVFIDGVWVDALYDSTYYKNTAFNIFDYTVSGTTGVATKVKLVFDTDYIGANVFEIGYVYSGNGHYTTKLNNISNHKTFGDITGCTPVIGINKQALRFNDDTDVITFDNVMSNQDQTIAFWANTPNNETLTFLGLDTGVPLEKSFIALNPFDGTGGLQLTVTNGTAVKTKAQSNFFKIDSKFHHYAFTLTSTKMTAYRDGYQIKSWDDDYSGYSFKINKLGFITQTALYPRKGLYPHVDLKPSK